MHLVFGGIKITEPATLLTDYVMGVVAIVCATRLGLTNRKRWAAAFWALAVSSLLGGTYHGFKLEFTANTNATLWRATIFSAFACSAFLLLAMARHLRGAPRYALALFAGLKFLGFAILGWGNPAFRNVLYDFAATFTVLVAAALWRRSELRGFTANLIVGIALFIAGGTIQALGLSPHVWFNHNDLFHLIQIAANLFIYRAAMNFPQDLAPPKYVEGETVPAP